MEAAIVKEMNTLRERPPLHWNNGKGEIPPR